MTTTRRRGPGRTARSGISRALILVALHEMSRPARMNELCNQLALTDPKDRKAVQNRLAALVQEGDVRRIGAIGPGQAHRYVPTNPLAPGILDEARASVALDGETRSILPAVIEATVEPERSTISVDDACVGMLLGMTGSNHVPIVELPAIVEWMRHTSSIVERLG